ncbi:MAG: hypothetical protein Phyf2KO_26940 [Phycisphaerales bacterium]
MSYPANPLFLMLPLSPETTCRLVRHPSPLQLTISPTPELASYITDPDMINAQGLFEHAISDSKPILRTPGETGMDAEYTRKLKDVGFVFLPATTADADLARNVLRALPAIGRLGAALDAFPMRSIAVRNLTAKGRSHDAALFADSSALIDITPPGQRRTAFGMPPDPNDYLDLSATEKRVFARKLLRTYAFQLGQVCWQNIREDQRADFIDRFELDNPDYPSTKRHPAVYEFAEAFTIACLYPTTFETEQVETYRLPTAATPSPPTGAFLEQIRFADSILDPIEVAYTRKLSENSAEPRPK